MANALEILRDRLSEDSVELSYDNIDGINTLRLVLDSIGEAEDGIVVLELSDIPLEEEADYGYYHFISVLANNIEAEQIADTLVNLNRINMETLLGNYAVVEEAGTVVHKYVLRTGTMDEKSKADLLYDCMVDVIAVIHNDYDRILTSIG